MSRRFELALPAVQLSPELSMSPLLLVDSGAQISLLLPSGDEGDRSLDREILHSVAADLREKVKDLVPEDRPYVGSGLDYVSVSKTAKGGNHIVNQLNRLRTQWHRTRHSGPLRVLVMGDSGVDIPMLTLEMAGIEFLAVFLSKHLQPGMVTPEHLHGRGAALALASLLPPEEISRLLDARLAAFPNEAYRSEIAPIFDQVVMAVRSIRSTGRYRSQAAKLRRDA